MISIRQIIRVEFVSPDFSSISLAIEISIKFIHTFRLDLSLPKRKRNYLVLVSAYTGTMVIIISFVFVVYFLLWKRRNVGVVHRKFLRQEREISSVIMKPNTHSLFYRRWDKGCKSSDMMYIKYWGCLQHALGSIALVSAVGRHHLLGNPKT